MAWQQCSIDVTFIIRHASDGKLYVYDMIGLKRNKDIAKAIFREEASGRNLKAASDILDTGMLTPEEDSVNRKSTRDEEYLELAKDPKKNAAKLQEMVKQTAIAAGYTLTGYHGTYRFFNEFKIGDNGYHIGSKDQAEAGLRDTENASDVNSSHRVMELMVRMNNPLWALYDFGDWHGKNAAELLAETEAFDYRNDFEDIQQELDAIAAMDDEAEADKALKRNGYNEGFYNIIVTEYEPDSLKSYLRKCTIVYEKQKMNGKYQVGSGRVVALTHDIPFIGNKLTPKTESVNRKSTRDEEYLELAKDPIDNRYRLQKMINDAAVAWGAASVATPTGRQKPIELFHGSPRFGFTEFHTNKRGLIYTTTATETSMTYGYHSGLAYVENIGKKLVPWDSPSNVAKNATNLSGKEYAVATVDDRIKVSKDMYDKALAMSDKMYSTDFELPDGLKDGSDAAKGFQYAQNIIFNMSGDASVYTEDEYEKNFVAETVKYLDEAIPNYKEYYCI